MRRSAEEGVDLAWVHRTRAAGTRPRRRGARSARPNACHLEREAYWIVDLGVDRYIKRPISRNSAPCDSGTLCRDSSTLSLFPSSSWTMMEHTRTFMPKANGCGVALERRAMPLGRAAATFF